MNDNLTRAKEIIKSTETVFAYINGGEIITSSAKGIGFIVSLCDSGRDLSQGAVADKIVGKAAALLFMLLGAKCVHAEVLSEGGMAIFKRYGIEFSYGTLTGAIQNRKGDGLCPMENAVRDIEEPSEAYKAVKGVLAVLKGQVG